MTTRITANRAELLKTALGSDVVRYKTVIMDRETVEVELDSLELLEAMLNGSDYIFDEDSGVEVTFTGEIDVEDVGVRRRLERLTTQRPA